MGFHLCPFCPPKGIGKYSNSSSGDVTLVFVSGRGYMLPDMILHYINDHGFYPSPHFIMDVMSETLISAERWQTKGIVEHVGYLENENYPKREVPAGFVEKLEQLMLSAVPEYDRERYKKMLYSK